jgi:hypothetical protein
MKQIRWAGHSIVAALAAISLSAGTASAQGWHYPAYQPPTIVPREFNFGISGGSDYGVALVGQWRERLAPNIQLSLDAGFASPSGGDNELFLGAGLAFQIMHATEQVPIDVLLTGGFYPVFGGKNGGGIRIPFGAVVGHRFALQGGRMAISPFAHPRLSLDVCTSKCGGEGSKVKLNFDLGADFEITPNLALRGAIDIGGVGPGDSQTGVGVSLAYRPFGISRATTPR